MVRPSPRRHGGARQTQAVMNWRTCADLRNNCFCMLAPQSAWAMAEPPASIHTSAPRADAACVLNRRHARSGALPRAMFRLWQLLPAMLVVASVLLNNWRNLPTSTLDDAPSPSTALRSLRKA